MNEIIKNIYCNWIFNLAFPNKIDRMRYDYLLNFLMTTPFIFTIPLDENRLIDGIDLRYRFCYEHELNNNIMDILYSNSECSVLEMMIALCLKFDEHILFDSDFGSRANLWFFKMLQNLKLDFYDNENFNEDEYYVIINKFLNREYDYNGSGGLFEIQNPKHDMRNTEIWYQMCWYYNEFLKN